MGVGRARLRHAIDGAVRLRGFTHVIGTCGQALEAVLPHAVGERGGHQSAAAIQVDRHARKLLADVIEVGAVQVFPYSTGKRGTHFTEVVVDAAASARTHARRRKVDDADRIRRGRCISAATGIGTGVGGAVAVASGSHTRLQLNDGVRLANADFAECHIAGVGTIKYITAIGCGGGGGDQHVARGAQFDADAGQRGVRATRDVIQRIATVNVHIHFAANDRRYIFDKVIVR